MIDKSISAGVKIFKGIDKDTNGTIDKEEMARFLLEIFNLQFKKKYGALQKILDFLANSVIKWVFSAKGFEL